MIIAALILFGMTPIPIHLSSWSPDIYTLVPSWDNTNVEYDIRVEKDCSLTTTVYVTTDVDLYYIRASAARSNLQLDIISTSKGCAFSGGEVLCDFVPDDFVDGDRDGVDEWNGTSRPLVMEPQEYIVSWRVKTRAVSLGELHLGSIVKFREGYDILLDRPWLRPFSAPVSTDGVVFMPVPFVPVYTTRVIPKIDRMRLLPDNEEVMAINRQLATCVPTVR